MKFRFRKEKYVTEIISKDLYNKWIKDNPEYSNIEFSKFKLIAYAITQRYSDKIIEEPHGVKLPFFCGEICIRLFSPKKSLNIKNYVDNKIKSRYLNFPTNGKTGKVVWTITNVRKFNKMLKFMGFSSCRNLTLKARDILRENPYMFQNIRIIPKK